MLPRSNMISMTRREGVTATFNGCPPRINSFNEVINPGIIYRRAGLIFLQLARQV